MASDPSPFTQDLARVRARLSEIPANKKGALVVAVEWKAGIPTFRTGLAARVGDHLELGADAEKRFREKPNAKIYAALTWLLLCCVLPASAQDAYHRVPLDKVATTSWTHVCTVAPVVYVRKMADGDYHVTLDNGRAKVVAELIPQIQIPPPKKGQRVEICGITRYDKRHRWPEIHPVTRWRAVR